MIQLPGYQPVASTSLLPAASGDAAAAPARSLLSVAQGIGGIGEVVGGMASDLLRVDNGRDLSEGRRTSTETMPHSSSPSKTKPIHRRA